MSPVVDAVSLLPIGVVMVMIDSTTMMMMMWLWKHWRRLVLRKKEVLDSVLSLS
jgi:hypothetical protein